MMDSQRDQLEHLYADCDCKSDEELHDHTKEPRPPDSEELDSDEDFDEETTFKLPVTVIVPRIQALSPQHEQAKMGNSLGSISLPQQYQPTRHQDLVWLGSSLGTMHKMPLDLFRTANRISTRTPSVLSKDRLSTSRYGSQTVSVSDCGTDYYTICRICQMPDDEKEPLISPCRCSGSLRYIHFSCLKKWIRISQRRGKKTSHPKCELCHYQFNRHKRFKFSQWRWPRVRRRDKCLHIIFLLNLLIMVGCAIATVMCFLSDRGNAVKFPKEKVKLTTEEVITLTCGVMFFVAFFAAMTVEIKARHTLYKLFLRFITHNTEWTVDMYDPAKDPLFRKNHSSVV